MGSDPAAAVETSPASFLRRFLQREPLPVEEPGPSTGSSGRAGFFGRLLARERLEDEPAEEQRREPGILPQLLAREPLERVEEAPPSSSGFLRQLLSGGELETDPAEPAAPGPGFLRRLISREKL